MKQFLFFMIAALLTSCGNLECDICDEKQTTGYCVTFNGSVGIQTKSGSYFSEGIKGLVYAYGSGDNPRSSKSYPGTPIVTISDDGGNLFNETNLFMPKGEYDFYSISENKTNVPTIQFTDGISGSLRNGIDYMWAKKSENIVQNTAVAFLFEHKAACISINVKEGTGVTGITLKSIKIALPDSTLSVMTLGTGEIVKSKSISSQLKEITISGLSSSAVILPLEESINLPFEIIADIKIGTEIFTSRKYTGVLKSPATGFSGGTIYKYSATVNASSISFTNAVIEDWKQIDIGNTEISEQR